jgi:uncharacterized membrane protein YedE/YeeE
MVFMETTENKGLAYWPNIWAGIGLGLVLIATFYIAGRGLGSSGALSRATAVGLHAVASEHAESLGYFARYFGESGAWMNDWLVFQVFGVFLGGLFGAITAGRFGKAVDKGPNISNGQRFWYAFLGGGIMGWGARLARGCTSGQALSGGATLAAGSWAFMLAMFAGGFITAFFVRKLWF